MIVHFNLGSTLTAGVLVPRIGSGVVVGRIAINGGRESALLVSAGAGAGLPLVVRHSDLVRVSA